MKSVEYKIRSKLEYKFRPALNVLERVLDMDLKIVYSELDESLENIAVIVDLIDQELIQHVNWSDRGIEKEISLDF